MKCDEFKDIKIVSGGQTGVDRGALEAAVALGLNFGGWAPHGWIAEDGTIPEQYREKMQEYPSMGGRAQDYRERTKANVRDSHATLILVDSLPLSGGTKLTEKSVLGEMIFRNYGYYERFKVHINKNTYGWISPYEKGVPEKWPVDFGYMQAHETVAEDGDEAPAEAAKRTYTILGRKSLLSGDWTPVPSGQEANYNFFKVRVAMK